MDLGSIHPFKRLASNFQPDPVHHRVVTDAQNALNGPQSQALGIQAQGLFTHGVINAPVVDQTKSALATAAQIALVSMAAGAVFDGLGALAVGAGDGHGVIVSNSP